MRECFVSAGVRGGTDAAPAHRVAHRGVGAVAAPIAAARVRDNAMEVSTVPGETVPSDWGDAFNTSFAPDANASAQPAINSFYFYEVSLSS